MEGNIRKLRKSIQFVLAYYIIVYIKLSKGRLVCKEGKNTLRFYGVSPAIVLERIVIKKSGITIPESYLGPTESYFHK